MDDDPSQPDPAPHAATTTCSLSAVACFRCLASALAGQPNLNYHKATTPGIGASNAADLKVLFKVKVNANESATPAVYNGVVFFPDWNGYLWAVNAKSGDVVWKKKVADLVPGASKEEVLISRVTPAIDPTRGIMVLGTLTAEPAYGRYAWMFAVTLSGKPVWATDLSYNPYAIVTMSPTIHDDAVFVGMSSYEETVASTNKTFECCTFRGSMFRLNLADGKVMWQTYVVPDNHGNPNMFSGIALWGSAPAVDAKRNRVYIGSGNNYGVPKWVRECLSQAKDIPTKAHCASVPNNWYDSVLAFDVKSGDISWGQRASAYDIWTVSCEDGTNPQNCKVPSSPDYDFAQAPLYFPGTRCHINGQEVVRDILVAAAKSGNVYGFNADDSAYETCTTGNANRLLWNTFTGVGSTTGGSEFGSTSDGVQTVFLQNTNSEGETVHLTKPAPGSKSTTNAGFWTAVDICTGAIKWQTAAPIGKIAQPAGGPTYSTSGSLNDGVVFGTTLAPNGTVYAMRATDGKIVSAFTVGASTGCAPSIVDDVLYIGSGYHEPGVTAGKYTWAFALPSVTSSSHPSPHGSTQKGPCGPGHSMKGGSQDKHH